MFELAGEKPEQAKAHAATVMRIETALAKGSLDRVSRRDPEKVYHKMTQQRTGGAWAPPFQWNAVFHAMPERPPFQTSTSRGRTSSRPWTREIQRRSLDDWKIYLHWHLLHSEAPLLPAAFVKENFDFYGKTLTGAAGNAAALEALRRFHRQRSWAKRWARSSSSRRSARKARSAR